MAKMLTQGATNLLDVYLGGAVRGDLYLGLYTDATEPAKTATLTTVSELPEGVKGYNRIVLADGDWTIAAGLATNLQKIFTAAGGDWGNVYGYFICDVITGTTGNLLFVQTFSDGPYAVADAETVKVTPSILAA